MFDILDDEFSQMFDEEERKKNPRIGLALTLHDPIKSLPKHRFVVLPENSVLTDVLDKLQQYSTGCVILQKDDKISGIFTERDAITKVIGKRLNFDDETVNKYMTPNPECLNKEDPISWALNKMVAGGFRHVPLVDVSKAPLGVISMQNIIHHLGEFFFDEIVNLPPNPQQKQTKQEGG